MSNNRIYYAIQRVGMKPASSDGEYNTLAGVQSVGMSTNFSLDPIFQLGDLGVYENIETNHEVKVSVNKVLDGCPLVYHRATEDSTTPVLNERVNSRSSLALGIYDDGTAATGDPPVMVECTGLYVSSLSYTFDIDGSFSEDVSLVGSNKVWYGELTPEDVLAWHTLEIDQWNSMSVDQWDVKLI